jgi:uncharacterized protein with HEPN domain
MYDKTLLAELLEQTIGAVSTVIERCECVSSINSLIDTKEGQERLDAICMKLIAIGESLKNIDKITSGKLLANYPQIEWKKIKGIRDIISHHYFDLDAEIIYSVCKEHAKPLLETLETILSDIII